MSKIKILFAEDLPTDVILAEREIQQVIENFESRVVETENDFRSALKEFEPDIVISDFQMPNFDGLTALKISLEVNPVTPFIMLTGSMNEETAVVCMKAGATDYVIKEHIKRLGPAVLNALSQKNIKLEKIKAEAELIESEARFKRLADNAQDIIYRFDIPNFKFTYISQALEEITGYKPEEVYKNPSLAIKMLHHDDWHMIEKHRTGQLPIKKPILLRWIHKNGNIIFGEHRNIPVFDRVGNLIAIEGIARDITEQIKSAEELKESEEKFRIIFQEHTAVQILVDGENGKIVDANKAAEDFYGWSIKELKEMYVDQINTSTEAEVHKEVANAKLENRIYYEFKNRIADGSIKEVEIFNSEIYIKGKRFIHSIIHDITEKKKSERALKESETRYKSVVESLNQAYYEADRRGKFLYCNPGLYVIGGYTDEDIEGNICFNLVAEEHRKEVMFACKKAIQNRQPHFTLEFKVVKKNGEKLWVEQTTHIEFDNNGNFIKAANILKDINERKMAEDQLKLLSRAIEQSPVTIIITDPKGRIEYVNPKFTETTGYEFEEVKGFNTNVLRTAKHPDGFFRDLWITINAGKDWQGEFYNKKKNGEYFWESVIISPIINSEGKITHFVAVGEDVTDKKKLKDDLEKSENRFHSVWNNASEGMSLLDHNGIIVDANKSFAELFETTYDNIILKPLSVLFAEDEKEAKMETFRIKFNTKNIAPYFEREVKLWNGKKKWFAVSNSFILDETNNILLLSIFSDITESKRMLQELTEAKEKAEEMNRIKTYFFANMSHELRTPFIGIIGYAELLYEILDDSESKELVEVIVNSSKRLINTLNKILSLSKLEFEKPELIIASVNITSLIDDAHKLYLKTAEQNNISLIKNNFTKPEIIQTDEKLIKEILDNLISNAIKYTREGYVTIDVAKETKGTDEFLIIKVSDTGVGIPKDKQEIVWQEFRQASEGLNRAYEGTGLGLTITKKYVEMLNGNIILESEPGKGSTFTISLPILKIIDNEPDSEYREEVVTVEGNFFGKQKILKRRKILYVEDDKAATELIKMIVSKHHDIETVNDSASALKVLETQDFDIFMIDINLGWGMNGIELMQEIRKNEKYSNSPFIAITAYAAEGDREEFLSKGFTNYISKPFPLKSLNKLIEEISISEKTT